LQGKQEADQKEGQEGSYMALLRPPTEARAQLQLLAPQTDTNLSGCRRGLPGQQ